MPRNAATQNNNTENMEQQVPFKVTITERCACQCRCKCGRHYDDPQCED